MSKDATSAQRRALCEPSLQTSPARKRLRCPKCEREFSRTEHLERHVRSHSKEKPFVCPDCGKKYSRFDVLTRHRRNAPHHSVVTKSTPSQGLEEGLISASINVVEDSRQHGQPDSALSNPLRIAAPDEIIDVSNPTDMYMPATTVFPTTYAHGVTTQSLAAYEGRHNNNNFTNTIVPSSGWMSYTDLPLPNVVEFSENLQTWNVDDTLLADLFDNSPFDDLVAAPINNISTQTDFDRAAKVKDVWYTRMSDVPIALDIQSPSGSTSGQNSPRANTPTLNDRARSHLRRRLQIHSFESPLPSIDFLNACIQLYFSKVHPVFPVIHPATFRPSKSNSNLTLAVCAAGTLFVGSAKAYEIGAKLFERLQKSTLLYWERARAHGPNALISIIQGAAVAQVFAVLSGNPRLLLNADAFHGPPIAWARQQHLFDLRNTVKIPAALPDNALDDMWHDWAKKEQLIRTGHALRIIDAELSGLLHHESIMRLDCRKLFPTSTRKLFLANTAKDWRSIYLADRGRSSVYERDDSTGSSITSFEICKIPRTSAFTAYCILEELYVHVLTTKAENARGSKAFTVALDQLCSFQEHFLTLNSQEEMDAYSLWVLWHSVFIAYSTDLGLLERIVGRDGPQVTDQERTQVKDWAESEEALRALTHALLIKKRLESTTILDEPAVHVPRALFNAAVVLSCYSKFVSPRQKERLLTTGDKLPELKFLGKKAMSVLVEAREPAVGVLMFQKTLYGIVQILQRIGSWPLSRRFATILTTIINEELEQI